MDGQACPSEQCFAANDEAGEKQTSSPGFPYSLILAGVDKLHQDEFLHMLVKDVLQRSPPFLSEPRPKLLQHPRQKANRDPRKWGHIRVPTNSLLLLPIPAQTTSGEVTV